MGTGNGQGNPLEVLEMATIGGARIMGRANEVGSLEVGKSADLVIFNSDPTKDIKNSVDIYRVMANGFLYSDDTLKIVTK